MGKRQVKAPKVYFATPVCCTPCMGVETHRAAASGHPRAGASWEGFALEQMLRLAQAGQAYFWATHREPSSTC